MDHIVNRTSTCITLWLAVMLNLSQKPLALTLHLVLNLMVDVLKVVELIIVKSGRYKSRKYYHLMQNRSVYWYSIVVVG